MRWTILRRVQLGIGVAYVVLCVVAVFSLHSTRSVIRDLRWVSQSYRALAELEQVAVLVKNISAGSRGFVITGQESFLEPYQKSVDAIHGEIGDVHKLIGTIPAQGLRLDRLEALVGEQIRFAQTTIELRKSQGRESAIKQVESGSGQALLDRIEGILAQLAADENRLLATREEEARRSARADVFVIALGGILALMVVGAAIYVLHRDVRARDRLEKAILAISEREQNRVGRDLHDGLCQQLTGIALLVQALENKIAAGHAATAGPLAKIHTLVADANAQARNMARGLSPVEIQTNGLMSALEQLAGYVQDVYGVDCRFESPEQVLIEDNETATHLYRITQEAVQNAVRHGKPGTLSIGLVRSDGTATLTIRDDGKGIPEETAKRAGMGFEIMRYRARTIGGQIAIERGEEGGTVVRCVFPVREESAEHGARSAE